MPWPGNTICPLCWFCLPLSKAYSGEGSSRRPEEDNANVEGTPCFWVKLQAIVVCSVGLRNRYVSIAASLQRLTKWTLALKYAQYKALHRTSSGKLSLPCAISPGHAIHVDFKGLVMDKLPPRLQNLEWAGCYYLRQPSLQRGQFRVRNCCSLHSASAVLTILSHPPMTNGAGKAWFNAESYSAVNLTRWSDDVSTSARGYLDMYGIGSLSLRHTQILRADLLETASQTAEGVSVINSAAAIKDLHSIQWHLSAVQIQRV